VVSVVRRAGGVLALAAAFACAEGFAPGARVSLGIVPVFAEAAPLPGVLFGDLDVVRIRVARLPSNTVVLDTSVAVDTAGNVDLPVTVPLLSDPEEFEILLQGIRSSDNAVLYEGLDTVPVVAGTTSPPPVQIVVSYIGPCQVGSGCQVTVGPQLASLAQGDSVRMTVTVDSLGAPVAGVPVSFANLDTALIRVRSSGYVVARTGTPGGAARVVADIRADADTLFLTVLPQTGPAPATVIVTPGYAALRAVAPNNTVQLADTVKDGSGNLLSPTLATWTSRNPSVASVSAATGLVTAGSTSGSAVIVAQAGTAADSIIVTVGNPASAPGDMLVAALTNARAFGVRRVGQAVTVDVRVDQLATADSLGSYTARYSWNPAVLRFDSTSAGTYAAPTVNDSSSAGVLRFAAVDANSKSGPLVLTRLWFTALSAGADGHALQISEMSGVSPAFYKYFENNRYVLVSGAGRITP
jgi:Cohesin domain